MVRKKVGQATDVCGACTFCRPSPNEKDEYLCWVSPPLLIGEIDNCGWMRGAAVGVEDYKCIHFAQRLNA